MFRLVSALFRESIKQNGLSKAGLLTFRNRIRITVARQLVNFTRFPYSSHYIAGHLDNIDSKGKLY